MIRVYFKVDLNKLEMENAAKEAAKERAIERELTIELVKKDRNNSTATAPNIPDRNVVSLYVYVCACMCVSACVPSAALYI